MFNKSNTGFWVLVATILGSCMSYIDSTVIYIALPVLQDELNATVVQTQWIVEAYVLFQAALILVGGSLGDRIGRRKIFSIGIIIFAFASALCGFATSANFLILARILQALGGAMLGPSSLAIISAYFDEKKRGHAIGLWSGISATTVALGPILGAVIVQNASWRWLFFLNIPLAAVALIVLYFYVPESRDEDVRGRLDWRGALLATLGLGGFTFGLIESSNYGFFSPIVIGSVIFGITTFALFLYSQSRRDAPLLPLFLFRSSTFSGANILTLLLYGALNGLIFFLPFNFIQIQGYDLLQAGIGFLPFPLIVAAFSGWAGSLVSRYGAKRPLMIGPLIVAFGFILFSLAGLNSNFWLTFFPAVIVLAIGMTIVIAPLNTTVMGAAPMRLSGTASGINTAINSTSNVLAVAILGIVALGVFTRSIDRQLEPMSLPTSATEEIAVERVKLANAQAPASLPDAQEDQVNHVLDLAFIDAFRVLMYVCAGLAILASIVSYFMISGKPGELAPSQGARAP